MADVAEQVRAGGDGLRGEEVVRHVGDAGLELGREGRFGLLHGVGEVLDDKGQVGKSFGDLDADVAGGASDLGAVLVSRVGFWVWGVDFGEFLGGRGGDLGR